MTDQFIPAWVDLAELARQICVSPTTVDNWVAAGVLPAPRKRGGKLMWKWSEVDAKLTNGTQDGLDKPGSIRDAVKREREADAHH
jgi:predicted DNA-binding transcriptional regulator AlpA